MAVTWNTSDVPTVAAADLLAALRIWHAETRKAPLAVATIGGRTVASEHLLERRIVDAFATDTHRSLAVILRLRCLMAAFTFRRFEPSARGGDEAWLKAAVTAASSLRVNADIGFSPVRLAWAISTQMRANEAIAKAA
jgi:hypothetical protein